MRPCPICHSTSHQPLGTRTLQHAKLVWVHDDVLCLDCGMVYDRRDWIQAELDDYYMGNYECARNADYPAQLALLKRYAPADGIAHDVSIGSMGDSLYDVVNCYYVLEHLIDPAGLVREMVAHLKPNGVLIVEVPDFERCPEPALFPEHLQQFTSEHLALLLNNAGLFVVESINGLSRPFGICKVAMRRWGIQARYASAKTAYGAECATP